MKHFVDGISRKSVALWVGAQGNGSYKVVISSKKLFLLSCESCVCVSISACMCFSGLHYPDELLREWASWVLWDIDWGDDPVSLHAFELAVCVSWWKRYFLQILGHDWRDSNFLDLWKGNDLVQELYSDHIWAVKCHYIMQWWSVGPPHTEIHLKKLLGRLLFKFVQTFVVPGIILIRDLVIH